MGHRSNVGLHMQMQMIKIQQELKFMGHKLRGHILGNGQLGLHRRMIPRDITMITSQKTESSLFCQGKVNRSNHKLWSRIGKLEGHFFLRLLKGQNLNLKDWPYLILATDLQRTDRGLSQRLWIWQDIRDGMENVIKKLALWCYICQLMCWKYGVNHSTVWSFSAFILVAYNKLVFSSFQFINKK